ncbi:MAG: metallophosphoesterase [Verrucomicrobiota bacterium]
MKSRRSFLGSAGSTLAAAGATGALSATEKPVFSFGLMADCQYADAEPRWARFYSESPRKLEEAVDELNQHELAFTFHLGDFIDRDFESFADLAPIAAKLQSKLHHALGNHDFDVVDERKADVLRTLGLERGFYSIRKDGFRFVVIDTTDFSTYRYPKNSEESRLAAVEMKRLEEEGSSAAKPWNSRPGDAQIAWLETELKAATKEGEVVIVCGHHPILPNAGLSIWNAAAMNELLQKYRCVKLYLNGHDHEGHYVDSEALHYLTLDGMVETENENAFAVADLYNDRLEISGFGRQESFKLDFR